VFSLSDIVAFIRHKQSTCGGGGGGVSHQPSGDEDRDNDDDDDDDHGDDDDDDETADRGCVNRNTTPAPLNDLYNDDKTVICANGTDVTTPMLRGDERDACSAGSTAFMFRYTVLYNCVHNCEFALFVFN